jgi:hypothetical protein
MSHHRKDGWLIDQDESYPESFVFAPRKQGGMSEPMRFINCTFGSSSSFNDQVFKFAIELENCRIIGVDNKHRFVKCDFLAGVRVQSPYTQVEFAECEFHSHLEANHVRSEDDRTSTATTLKTVLESCTFKGPPVLFRLKAEGKLKIIGGEDQVHTMLGDTSKTISVNNFMFLEHTTVVVSSSTERVALESCFMQKDMLIRALDDPPANVATSANDPRNLARPEMMLKGLARFAGAKIIFSHLDLGNYDLANSDFLFYNVELDDVTYPEANGHRGFAIEDTIERKLRPLSKLQACYNNLKVSYDQQSDYQASNNFHTGELWAQWQIRRLYRARLTY